MDWIEKFFALVGPDPRLQGLLILVVAGVVAKLSSMVTGHFLPRLTRHTRTDLDDDLLQAIRRPIFFSVLLIGAYLALLRVSDLASVPRDEWPSGYSTVVAALKTFAIFTWLWFLSRLAKLVLKALSRNRDRFSVVQPQTLPVLENVASLVVLGGGIYFLLLAWGVEVSGWVASAGIAGLALSLAAKDTLANLFAGMAILADSPCKVGDFIILETGERGEVTRIGIRSSRLLTRDDIEIVIPNSILANSKIINEAGGPGRQHRVRVQVQVAYGSDLPPVRATLMQVAADLEEVCETPEPRVRFRSFGESGLDIELLCWVEEPVLRGRVLDALNSEVYQRFRDQSIEIPYPKRDLYVHGTAPMIDTKIANDPQPINGE